MIQNHIKEIALDLLGEPNKKLSTDKELRFGTYGSMSVDIEKGTFFSHEDNEGGGTIDLVKRYVSDHVDYLKKYEEPKTRDNIKDIYPYTDKDGKTLYEVVRFEPKTFRPRRMNGTGYVWNLQGVVQVPYRLKDIYDRRDEVIYIVEGEKDANTLAKMGYVATTNCFGASNWKVELNSHFSGRDCVIVPDNDQAGKMHSEKVVEQLKSVCSSLKVVNLPVANESDDVTDYFGWLGSKEEFDRLVKDAPSIKCKPESTVPFQSWATMDAMMIPPRRFLYNNHYIRDFASITIATGGIGKSTLCLTEMIAMATNMDLLGSNPEQRCRVLYINGEDPIDEIQRRIVAICEHHQIDQSLLVDHLYYASGRDYELLLSQGSEGDINENQFKMIEEFCLEKKIDVFCLDPLANLTTSPETNEIFRTLTKRISELASNCNLSVEIVHHTRKGIQGMETTVESARGGSSLIAAVRSARVLSPMTKEEAEKCGLETHVNHFRMELGKSNLARPIDKAVWFQRVGHDLDNGDQVAVLNRWEMPDMFSGMSIELGRKIQRRIESERPKQSPRADNWGGKIVIEMMELDIKESDKFARLQATQILKEWVRTDVLRIYEDYDKRSGRTVKFYCEAGKVLSE